MTELITCESIGAISLFVLATTGILCGLARLADERRAYRATRYLVGRAYWSPNLVMADPIVARWFSYQLATLIDSAMADAPCFAAGTMHLPRGWRPTGKVIDAEARSW